MVADGPQRLDTHGHNCGSFCEACQTRTRLRRWCLVAMYASAKCGWKLGWRPLGGEPVAAQVKHQFLLPRVNRRQRTDHPAEQPVGQAGITNERGAVQIGTDHPPGVSAL